MNSSPSSGLCSNCGSIRVLVDPRCVLYARFSISFDLKISGSSRSDRIGFHAWCVESGSKPLKCAVNYGVFCVLFTFVV